MKTNVPKKARWVAVSGGFDPIHIGHARLFQAARKFGDKLVVILNNDNWLRAKKGFVFMPQKERAELLRTLPFVDRVVVTDHRKDDPDRSVARALERLKPAVFANGGDRGRGNANTLEEEVCEELGIEPAYGVGRGGKVQSSSWMIGKARRDMRRSKRPWGEFYGWDSGRGWNLKTVYVRPGKRLSLQYHRFRSEWWMLVEGDATAIIATKGGKTRRSELRKGVFFKVRKGAIHRLASKNGGVVVEIAFGDFDENDIVRVEDDFGRSSRRIVDA